jgi:glycosyltransferase involved in cell wall biosynthesis
LAWRIGRDLGIPSCGWATGSDVRVSASSSLGKVVIRALANLDLIFFQSSELLESAANLINKSKEEMSSEKYKVLPRGIPTPPQLPTDKMRKKMRLKWGVDSQEIVVLSLGRIIKEKGVYELLDAFSSISQFNKRIICILIGAIPAFDETTTVKINLENDPVLKDRVRIFPACKPNEIWEIFCGADIFAFTSHKEGMPNSLLEAMASGLPAIAFAIPPIEEIDAGTGSLIKVPPFNSKLFAEAILELSESRENRDIIGEKGKKHVMKHFQINKNMACALEEISKVINK